MHIAVKIVAATVGAALIAAAGFATWHIRTKLPVREGTITLNQLKAPVTVAYDDRGVPHIRAENEMDMYRALGYVHAQDRLFQMEMVRRLAKGELAEILGPKLLETDKLFRTLGIRARAEVVAAQVNPVRASDMALLSYLDGINQYQASHPAPLEFDILKIPKRPFTPQDTFAVSGYLAYSFAAGLRTDPPMTYIRDNLGPDYLRIFDLEWHPEGVIDQAATSGAAQRPTLALGAKDWKNLNQLAELSQSALQAAGDAGLRGQQRLGHFRQANGQRQADAGR
jgi:penicillin amidase